ncbi:MAG: hypothetical protein PUD59_01785 [bacterium]|nr:hypothetical protein [bacterium]
MKKGIKRFSLIYEPKKYYNSKQYIVNFKINREKSTQFIEIEKNSCFSNIKKGKFMLSDIDKITNKYQDIYEFCKDNDIKDSIHSMFINTSYNKYYGRIEPVFNDEHINQLLLSTENDQIISKEIIDDLYNKLMDNNFYFCRYFINSKFYKTLTFEEILKKIIYLSEYNERIGYTDYESVCLYDLQKRNIKIELEKYSVAREVTRAFYSFQKTKMEQNQIVKKVIESNQKVLKNKPQINEETLQYKMPGW